VSQFGQIDRLLFDYSERECIDCSEGSEQRDFSRGDSIILDTREILKYFHSWSVSHARREGNKGAHFHAKYAIFRQLYKVWVHSYFNCLSEIGIIELLLSDN
jgi:hypothetical protein